MGKFNSVLIVVLALALSACGFKLRGQAALPSVMALTYIDVGSAGIPGERSQLVTEISRGLKSSGVVVVDRAQDASARLLLQNIDYRRRALAANRTGAVREYNLEYIVSFSVFDAQDKPFIDTQQIRVSRDTLYDETQVLGSVAGEQIAIDGMIRDAAAAVLRRIQTVSMSLPQ